ncbi:glycosyl transferase, partial [Azospirillum argentinense]
SRRFIKSFPALASGFETETELTVHALELRMPIAEIKTPYKDRPPGSHSKLNTIRDGIRILRTIINLVKEERPLPFFGILAALLAVVALILAAPLLATYLHTGEVPRLPTAVLSTGLMLLAFLSLTCGLVLDTVTLGRREAKRMRYLAIPAPGTVPPGMRSTLQQPTSA